jgi:CheY-like chemotaxis protein
MESDPGPPSPPGPPGDDEFIDRRSGVERRGGGERRQGGRRHRRQGVSDDRRTGKDRRKETRRRVRDRRRVVDPRYTKRRRTSAGSEYSAQDVATVQRLLTQVGGRVSCPACDGPFALGPVDRRGRESIRPVWCAQCGRGTVVTNCLLARVMVLTRIESLRQSLNGILTAAGHEVLEPPHIGAALDAYRANPADVVLLDAFALDQMDGREFIRRLRQEFPDPRIVILAPRPSYRTADPSAAAEQLGASGVLRMPVTRDDLLRAVRDARA